MTIRFIYMGSDDISRSPIIVITGDSAHTLSGNDVCIEVPDNADSFILKEAWIKTKPYRFSSDKKQITVLWNKAGSLFLALFQILLFQSSSLYFKIFIDDERRTVQWNSRKKDTKTAGCRYFSLLPVRLLIECGIFALCIWCGYFLGRMITSFFR